MSDWIKDLLSQYDTWLKDQIKSILAYEVDEFIAILPDSNYSSLVWGIRDGRYVRFRVWYDQKEYEWNYEEEKL